MQMFKCLLLVLSTFILSFQAKGQILDGYKYIFVEPVINNQYIDIWGIGNTIKSFFTKKGFIVLKNTTQLPDDAWRNPCMILNCQASFNSTDEVVITLKNCLKKVVLKSTGKTNVGDYTVATMRALSFHSKVIYKFNPKLTPVKTYITVAQTNETENSIETHLSSHTPDLIEGIYKSIPNDDLPFYKFGIIKRNNKYLAIVLESDFYHWKIGEVKAIFEPSSMDGLYTVTWYTDEKKPIETVASMDNQAILSIANKHPLTGANVPLRFIKFFPSILNNNLKEKVSIVATGSGFFINANGIIATNAHVVSQASEIKVTMSNDLGTHTYNAKLLLIDNNNDVALLQVEDSNFTSLSALPYGLEDQSLTGSKVFTIGYPLNSLMGKNFKVTDGIISAQTGIADDVRYYQISVPIQPGNSGGPLFNASGNIIGLTTAKLNGEAIGVQVENVGYAIKSQYLFNLYNMLPNNAQIKPTTILSAKPLEEQVKILKNYVCLIQVTK